MSYFVGGNVVDEGYEEDAGFAINGGKGWKKVVFENSQVDYSGNVAIAMGTYYFTCATTDEVTRVEYTFGYKRCDDGKPRIFLHHSSVPCKCQKPDAPSNSPMEEPMPRAMPPPRRQGCPCLCCARHAVECKAI